MKKIETSEFKELLDDTARRIEKAQDNTEINGIIEQMLTSLMQSEFASLWIFDENEASLVRARPDGHVQEVSMLSQHGVLAKSFFTLSGGIYNYLASEKEYLPEIDNPDDIRMKSKIILPLIDGDRLLGIATAYSSVRHKQNFDEEDMELLEAAAPFLNSVVFRMFPEKQGEYSPLVYLSERIKEASAAAVHKVEVIREEEKRPAKAPDEMIGFLANTVHDIRTPANALYGFLELLEGQIDNQRLLQYIQNAKESARFINDLTTSILDQVSSQRNRAAAQPVQISPAKFIADIAEIFSANMSDKRLEYFIFIDPLIPKEVRIEADKLKRVLINLIGNAYKFTPANRSIALSTVYDPSSRRLDISVSDTGIGIAEENQQKIFEAFKQATDDTADAFGGTGLGLSISAQYVKDLGGELKLESELDKGSRFYFSIPLDIGNDAETFARLQNSSAKIAILLDDSNTATAKNIMRYLLRMGLSKSDVSAIRSITQVTEQTTNLIVFQNKLDDDVKSYASQTETPLLVVEEQFLSMSKDATSDVISQYGFYADSLHAILSSRTVPKILVADDDKINIELIKAILVEEFCKVETAPDGQIALDMLKNAIKDKQPYSLVFIDKHMPNISGDEVIGKLRNYEKKHGLTPIYAVSISGDPKLDTSDKSLFNAYVGKPFNKKKIKETLKEALA